MNSKLEQILFDSKEWIKSNPQAYPNYVEEVYGIYEVYGLAIIDKIISICREGEKTQTTCKGVEQAIIREFGIQDLVKQKHTDTLVELHNARELFKNSALGDIIENAICEIESLRMEVRRK